MSIVSELELTERELRIRGYSRATIRSYLHGIREYLAFKNSDPTELDQDNIKSFLLFLERKNLAPETRNLYLNAIKFYYRRVVRRGDTIPIRTVRKNRRLPVVLSREDIHKLLSVTKNKKHRLLLSLAYGAGLRVSEVANLTIADIDFSTSVVSVRQGKGRRDRVTVLPERIAQELRAFTAGRQAGEYLFPSERGGKLTTRTCQKVFEQALIRSGIRSHATFHSLRHSFATHLLENGTDIRYVQSLLGHRNIRTTMHYTQVTNPQLRAIRSPL